MGTQVNFHGFNEIGVPECQDENTMKINAICTVTTFELLFV